MPASKYRISPGQALLILLDHHRNLAGSERALIKYKRLYFKGMTLNDLNDLACDPILANYIISKDPETIDQDPTRRYFETHFAYESIIDGLDKISVDDLRKHVDNLKGLLGEENLSSTMARLNDPAFQETTLGEYNQYKQQIENGSLFKHLGSEDKEKIQLLLSSWLYGVVNAWQTEMPLNVYGRGFYGTKARGRKEVPLEKLVKHRHFGLMKNHMPL
ncbi:MAG: hypothetical protein QNK11_08190, partial [Legionella sp.]|nr:hypothetical protein [Legionella sp.]